MLAATLLFAGFATAQNRVYELRTYTCNEGKLEALKTRFRDHTIEIFKRHGMESIGYWVPQDGEKSKTTLIYIIVPPQPRSRPPRTGRNSAPIRSGRRSPPIPKPTAKSCKNVGSRLHGSRPISRKLK